MASQPEEADNRGAHPAIRGAGAINPNTSGNMRSGSNQPPRGRYNGGRPFQQQPRPAQRNQSLDSNGPNIKIRGSAHQIFERYVALAREAATSGDRIAAENFYQHAEHYFRIANASRDGSQQGTSPSRPRRLMPPLAKRSRYQARRTRSARSPAGETNGPASFKNLPGTSSGGKVNRSLALGR
jgi:hypothetical protein